MESLGGIASRSQLIQQGIRGPAISRAVQEGVIRRVRRAHYRGESASFAAVAAVRVGGRLGCVGAAHSYGIWTNWLDTECVHVALPANAARLRTNRMLLPSEDPLRPDRYHVEVDLHWSDVPVGLREPGSSAWRVPLEVALAQLARCLDRVDVLAAFESAAHLGLMSAADAHRLLNTSAPARLGRMTIRGLDGSGAETYLAEAMRAVGLSFIQQVPFSGVGFVDFLVEGRLIVEVDGYQFHKGRKPFKRDRGRDGDMLGRGIPTLRIPADDVVADPVAAALLVVNALAGIPTR
jgi:very-short-patch-repair endonuclease